jgi:SWI/SNF-related matrix-associated actin-dependent regulator of chromatin subfamily B protein 1
VNAYLKSLIVLGYAFDGSPIPLDELATSFLPPIDDAHRSPESVTVHTPTLQALEGDEFERVEKDRDRDSR